MIPDFSDGVMVAVQVPPGTAARVARPGGTPADDLHCTLAYLGSVQELSDEQQQGILQAAQETANDSYPLEADAPGFPGGHGTFEPGDDGVPYWLDPNTPGLHNLHESLMRNLQTHDLDHLVSTEHGFNPHVTLDYLPEDARRPSASEVPAPAPMTWANLIVSLGTDTYTYPLGGSPHVPDTGEQDLQPAPILIPGLPTEQPVPLTAAAVRSVLTPQVELNLRRQLSAHNSSHALGQRTTLEALRAVYLRGATAGASNGRPGPSSRYLATSRVRAFLSSLSTASPCRDQDLVPAAPRRSRLYPALQLAQEYGADDVTDLLLASALLPTTAPRRQFTLNRALALASASPAPAVRASLPTQIRALLADGNSSVARSLRAKRQLRDRYGRWIEQGGGVRFKVRSPGAPGGGRWYHGTVIGQDVPNGRVNVRLEDGQEVAVPADKIEQPLAILPNTSRARLDDPDRDPNAPTVSLAPVKGDDTGARPSSQETEKALDDAGRQLARRVGDDSTEAHHRDALLEAAGEAVSGTNTPEELQDHLARLSEYADNVARGNQGRMTPDEAEAFRGYAEDLQDIVAAHAPETPAKARLPKPDSSPAPDGPVVEAPQAEPVDTAAPDPSVPELPDLHEFSDAADNLRNVVNETDAAEPKDRLAAAHNVIENVGDDFLNGQIDAAEAMDALERAHNEIDSVITDHFDDLPDGAEDDLNDVMDQVSALRTRIAAWNDTPDDTPGSNPAPEGEASPPAEETPAPVPDAPEPDLNTKLSAVIDAIDQERAFLDREPDFAEGNGADWVPPQKAIRALEALKQVALDDSEPDTHADRIKQAYDDYLGALGPDGDSSYSLAERIADYSGDLATPAADAPAAAAPDPWGDAAQRAVRSPSSAGMPPSEPGLPPANQVTDAPEPSPEDYKAASDEVEADPFNAERVHFQDMRADYENGLLPDEQLVPAVREMLADLAGQKSADADDLHDEIQAWFNRRQPVTPQRETAQPDSVPNAEGLQMQDMNGEALIPGEWVDIGDGVIKGELVSVGDGEVRIRSAADGQETNVAVTPAQIRKLSLEEVEALGGDPTNRGLPPRDAPAAPDGPTDQFGNPVPARMKLARETNLPGGGKVQTYRFDDDPDGATKVDVSVGTRQNGDHTYTVRYRNSPVSNHDNWDDAVAAAQAELDRVAPLRVEDRAREERVNNDRAAAEAARAAEVQRRVDGNLDNADRPLPEGWSHTTMPNGESVMTGPGRYRAFSDANGDLHLLVRDNQGGFATLGTFKDWDEVKAAITEDEPRRAQSQRDEAAEWLAGHGFSEDTVNEARTNYDSDEVRARVQADPRYKEMLDAAQGANDADRRNARERQAAQDWTDLQNHLRNVEDLPVAPPETPAPDAAPGREVPSGGGGLSRAQQQVIASVLNDLDDADGHDYADAIEAFIQGDRAGIDALGNGDREDLRDEIIGRANAALQRGDLTEEEARQLVQFADDLYNPDLRNDPNDGLIEPVGIPTPEPNPWDRVPTDQAPPAPAPAPGVNVPAADSNALMPWERELLDAANQPRPAGAPAGQENRYHPDGVVQGRDGVDIFKGQQVRARRDGAVGEVVAVQQQPPYARIRFADGRVLVRAANQLEVTNRNEPAPEAPAPRNAAELADAIANAPAAPEVPDMQGHIAALQEIRDLIPRRVGAAGHRDARVVARRNAGFALDDALTAFRDGNLAEGDRHLVRAIQRLGFGNDEADRISELRRAMNGEQPVGDQRPPSVPADAQRMRGRPDFWIAAGQVYDSNGNRLVWNGERYVLAGEPAPAARPNVPAGPAAIPDGAQPADWLQPRERNGLAEQAVPSAPPGVSYVQEPGQDPDAVDPSASLDDYAAWGDRAPQIVAAARNRPSLDALRRAARAGDTETVARVFGADGNTRFGSKNLTVKVRSAVGGPEGVTVKFDVFDAEGRNIRASLERQIVVDDDGRVYVYNALMSLPDSYQGGGFAEAWNQNIENWAIPNGIAKVKVSAGLSKGGLVWALNGFDFDGGYGIKSQATKLLRSVKGEARTDAEKAQVRELERRIEQRDYPTPLEIALVGYRPGVTQNGWAGSRGLTGMGWHGVKNLTPDAKTYVQRDGFAQARAAAQRVKNNENVAQVSDAIVSKIQSGQPSALSAAERASVVDALSNGRSLATLTPAAKRKLGDWVKDGLNTPSGDDRLFEDQYNVFRALRGEHIADARQQPLGVGEELRDVPLAGFSRNNVPGWSFRALGGEGGINSTWEATHLASGQIYYVKNDTYDGAAGRRAGAGRDSEADVNQLLRAADGGWVGINANAPSRVAQDVIIQQRVGDNVDLQLGRPRNASGQPDLMNVAFRNGDSPDSGLRMFLLDIMLGNGDRHNGNWMLAKDADGRGHIFPIDHGLAGGGVDWRTVDNLTVAQRVERVRGQGAYQLLRQQLERFSGHSVEYMAREIMKDYKAALNGNSVWYDPQFQTKALQQLNVMEAQIRRILKAMGH